MQNTVVPKFEANRGRLLVVGALAHAILVGAWWLIDDREVTRELWTAFGWAWLLWAISLISVRKRLSQLDQVAFGIATGTIAAFGVIICSNTVAAIKGLLA